MAKTKFDDYEGFVEKFNPKKTTDDCYTPPEVYDVVLEHVRNTYGIDESVPIVCPFYPGGDYELYEFHSAPKHKPPSTSLTALQSTRNLVPLKTFLVALK